MTASDQADTRDPAEIERDIRATQAEMSRTADQIGDQFTPKKLLNSLFDKADENGIDARYVFDGARRNPIALAMIALGGIWLVSDSDAKTSTLKPSGGFKLPSFGKDGTETDSDHRGYIDHMSRCEQRADEDDTAYLRRRAQTRANYLMIEQRHDEDEPSFRDRLDKATDALREKRDNLMNRASDIGHDAKARAGDMGRSARSGAGNLTRKADALYGDNPLAGGVIAALAGALVGAALPVTRTEEEQLGSLGAKALDAATDKAHELGDIALEKKDEVVSTLRTETQA